jgi:hypothetical protein
LFSTLRVAACLFLAHLFLATPVFSQVINLKGSWKFHVDDKAAWAAPDLDDSKWETIYAPSPWEDEGFNNYDGFAWYRKKFDGRKLDENTDYILNLGYIDDCDQVYLNGYLIAFSGSMPPKFKTAYTSERKYSIPAGIINYKGDNTIAIRVYDVVQGGGIIDGDIGIYRTHKEPGLLISLRGIWSFVTVDDDDQHAPADGNWKQIMVPSAWEHQGYSRYDGFAWYKKTFTLPQNFTNEPIVLLLGKIDDFDKVYLNGQLIGTTNDHRSYGNSNSYTADRIYDIPAGALKRNGTNTIEVLVEDMGNWGGIYEGEVGIALKSRFRHRD